MVLSTALNRACGIREFLKMDFFVYFLVLSTFVSPPETPFYKWVELFRLPDLLIQGLLEVFVFGQIE